jgi:hypothetical protein
MVIVVRFQCYFSIPMVLFPFICMGFWVREFLLMVSVWSFLAGPDT